MLLSGFILLCILLSYVPLRVVTILSVCGTFPGLYDRLRGGKKREIFYKLSFRILVSKPRNSCPTFLRSNYIVLLKFVNSMTNPLIYMITTQQFRKAVKKIIPKRTTFPSMLSIFSSSKDSC